jgi:uncharacterized membrane protein YhhN
MIIDSLTDEDFQALTNYVNKATAWVYVGVGGLLIAVKETYELTHGLEWPIAVFWVLLAVMAALSVGNAVARDTHTNRATARRATKSRPIVEL